MSTLARLIALLFFTGENAPVEIKGAPMTTGDTVRGYFKALEQKEGWESFLADGMTFTSFTSPVKQVAGKNAYLQATQRFYASIVAFEVRDLIVENEKACARTRYDLQGPGGNRFSSDVAELFTVKDGKIISFSIYFDPSPFPK